MSNLRGDHRIRRGLLALAACSGLALLAAEAVYAAEDARVLPKGRGRFSFMYAQSTGITHTFDSGGHAESLTAPYNIDLSSENLASFDPRLNDLVTALNDLYPGVHYNPTQRDNGRHGFTTDPNDPTLGQALSRGFLSVDAEAKHTEMRLGLMYGVTDRLSVGMMVPLIKNIVDVQHGLIGTNTADDIYRGLVAQSPGGTGSPEYQELLSGLNDLRNATDETLQALLISKGYSRFESYEGRGLGDLVFGGRYNWYNEKHSRGELLSSIQVGVTMPTGKTRPPSELTQIDFGQGAWDIGVANIINYRPNPVLILSQSIHITHRFWNERLMRVRKSPSEFIPDQSDEHVVGQHLGDKYWTTLGATLSPTRALTLSTSYEWYWKSREDYDGPRTDRDYTYLADGTNKYVETWQLGASLSSLPAFLGGSFPLPLDLSFDAFIPIRGRNSPIAPYGVAQLSMYF
jgi:hypothetical protein